MFHELRKGNPYKFVGKFLSFVFFIFFAKYIWFFARLLDKFLTFSKKNIFFALT